MTTKPIAAAAAALMLLCSGCGEAVDINSGSVNIATLSDLEKWDAERSSGNTAQQQPDAPAENAPQATNAGQVITADIPADAPQQNKAPAAEVSPAGQGNIFDCNGRLLMYTDADSGKRVIPEAYAVPFGNILSCKSDGLDGIFGEILSQPDTSVQLTFDADIQNAIYQYMASMNMNGCVVVLRTDGSVAAEVSYPSYDPALYGDADDSTRWGALSNHAMQSAPPGSVFKIMSEVIADKHGIDTLYDDGTWYSDSGIIVNWDHDTNPYYPIEERSRHSAFINSSNIFFAKTFDIVGTEAVTADLSSIFHFGRDIYCDFGTIFTGMPVNNTDDLRRSAFGQANVTATPMFLAALAREAVFGDMAAPFVLMNTVKGNNVKKIKSKGTSPELIASIPAEYRQDLLEGMAGVGADIGIYPPEGYSFFAKTGTAETGWGEYLYINGCLRSIYDDGSLSNRDYSSYNGSYIITTQINNGNDLGFTFASESAWLYQGIVNIVTSY